MTAAMIALSLAAGGLMVAAVAAAPDAAHRQEVEKWRAKHEADYRKDYVGLAGLFSLKPGANTVGSAASNDIVLPKSAPAVAGRFVLTGDRVRFEPQAGVKVTLKGMPVTGPIELKHDEAKDGPDEIQVSGVGLWVHLSGERRTIRMRDDQRRGRPVVRGLPLVPDRREIPGDGKVHQGSASRRTCTSRISWATTRSTRPKASSSSRWTDRPCGFGR